MNTQLIINKIQNINKIMKSDSQCSQDEGFYKPSIQITQPTPIIPTQFASIQQDFDNPNQIITQNRPTDFLPRFLATQTTYQQHMPQFSTNQSILDKSSLSALGQFMQPIPYNKNSSKQRKDSKQKRYKSLQLKYKNSSEYELAYSKIPENAEFSSYIFCLENTPDYNPNDFVTVSGQSLPLQPQFDSRFESGNLLYAFRKVNSNFQNQFDLIMQNDTNTNGYSQWFYFAVKNKNVKKMRINIVNFIKKHLMFLDGVRPVAFSMKKYEKLGKQWEFVGENISYGKSYITRQISANPPIYKNYYCLSFDITFQQQQDTVYIAYNYPYTYTRMINHTNTLLQKCPQNIKMQRNILCHSISNNPIPYLIIEPKQCKNSKTILCLARQHPGETVGSFVLQAFLNNLMVSKMIQCYRFVIVPMVNPDGVIYGNFRTNLSGFDLNRQWSQPNRWLHPQIFFLSKLIFSLENLQFCMDFHGHSKKMNSFIYACVNQKINQFRLYPYIYSQNCQLFSIKDCTFNITADKMKTARVNVFNQVKKPFVFTLETSFFGHTKENKYQRFSLADFQIIGKGGVQSLEILMTDKVAVAKYQAQCRDKNYLFEQWAMQNKQDDGSQSNPSEDQLNPVERKAKVMSDVKAKRPAKNKKNSKIKKRQRSIKKKKQSIHLILKQKADSASLLESKRSDKKMLANSRQDNAVIIFQDSSKKIKSQARKQINQTYIQPKIKPPPPIMPRPQQIKTMGPNALRQDQKEKQKLKLINTLNSNLFDTSNYLKMREHISFELKKQEQSKLQINLRETSLQLPQQYSSRFNKFKAKKQKRQLEQLAPVYSQPKKKSRQKVYIIKQNKVVSSITRVNQQRKSNIEKQISNRTIALKNCQKIMNGDKSFLNIDKPEYLVEEDPYKTKKLLRPLDIKRHKNFHSFREEEKGGIFFSFLDK